MLLRRYKETGRHLFLAVYILFQDCLLSNQCEYMYIGTHVELYYTCDCCYHYTHVDVEFTSFRRYSTMFISYLQTGLYTDDRNASLRHIRYQPPQNGAFSGPFPVYLLTNTYTVTSFYNPWAIVSDDPVRTIPIPTRPRTTSDGKQ